MPLRTDKILALLQEKLATLDLDKAGVVDAKPHEKEIAEELFHAVQDLSQEHHEGLDAVDSDDVEDYRDLWNDDDSEYDHSDCHNPDHDRNDSMGKIENPRIKNLKAAMKKVELELEDMQGEREYLEDEFYSAREAVETYHHVQARLLQGEILATKNLDTFRKNLTEIEYKLQELRQSLRAAEDEAEKEARDEAAAKWAHLPDSTAKTETPGQQPGAMSSGSFNGVTFPGFSLNSDNSMLSPGSEFLSLSPRKFKFASRQRKQLLTRGARPLTKVSSTKTTKDSESVFKPYVMTPIYPQPQSHPEEPITQTDKDEESPRSPAAQPGDIAEKRSHDSKETTSGSSTGSNPKVFSFKPNAWSEDVTYKNAASLSSPLPATSYQASPYPPRYYQPDMFGCYPFPQSPIFYQPFGPANYLRPSPLPLTAPMTAYGGYPDNQFHFKGPVYAAEATPYCRTPPQFNVGSPYKK